MKLCIQESKFSNCYSNENDIIYYVLLKLLTLKIIYAYVWYMGASLGAHFVKNPPAIQETLVRLLGLQDPLEKR